MKKIKLFKKDKLYGIICDGKELVPPLHINPKSAINEWKWFEIDNSKQPEYKKYLQTNRTTEKIMTIEKKTC